MKLFMVHVGFYDKSIGEGIYETHLNYFIAAEDSKDAKTKTHALKEFQERTLLILFLFYKAKIKLRMSSSIKQLIVNK